YPTQVSCSHKMLPPIVMGSPMLSWNSIILRIGAASSNADCLVCRVAMASSLPIPRRGGAKQLVAVGYRQISRTGFRQVIYTWLRLTRRPDLSMTRVLQRRAQPCCVGGEIPLDRAHQPTCQPLLIGVLLQQTLLDGIRRQPTRTGAEGARGGGRA